MRYLFPGSPVQTTTRPWTNDPKINKLLLDCRVPVLRHLGQVQHDLLFAHSTCSRECKQRDPSEEGWATLGGAGSFFMIGKVALPIINRFPWA